MRQMKLSAMVARGLIAGVVACVVAMTEKSAMATEIQRVVSPSGIEAWLVEERAIPIVSIQIGFRGGASRESADKSGLATLFAGMLEEGAGPYDAAGFTEKAEEIAARFSFSANRDAVRVDATMLAERRDESLELLRLALTEPRFDPEPLARVKAQMISGIRQAETDPDRISAKTWFAAAFPDDAYGRSTRGSLESVESLTAEDLRAAQGVLLNRSTMKIGVVGAISAEELGPILDELLGGLAGEALPPLPTTEFAASPGVEVVTFDAPQSVVIFGHEGLTRDDEDFIPAYVMNYVLGGGGFASRLMEEVREKRGLAYGVYSYLSPLDRAALYLGGVATENGRVAESIEVVKAEWSRLAENGLSEEELEKAKRYLTGAFPLRFDSNAKIAAFLVNAQLDDLGIDYIVKRNDLVEAVTVEDIKRVAKRALRADELFFVVVGKPEGLASN